MNFTQTVRVTLVSFVLLLGFYHIAFASPRLRQFIYVSDKTSFDLGINKCLKENASLATLFDYEDVKLVKKLFDPKVQVGYWLSLRRTRVKVSTWSDGSPYEFNKSSHTDEEENQICEAIVNGTWTGYDCSKEKDFMCSQGNTYRLVEGKKKNWCQAQQYCRTHFTDLVSITSEDQNKQVVEIGQNKTFWIGLMHDKWEWDKKICSTYRNWTDPGKGFEEPTCAIQLRVGDEKIKRFDCGSSSSSAVICSKGTVRIIVVNRTLTWEDALDYCEKHHTGLLWIRDGEDMKAVRDHLKGTDGSGPFWIGLRQSPLFGFWIWKDRVVTYNNWENDKPPEAPMSQLCGVIQTNENYTWTDENCSFKRHFLCEEEVSFNDK